MYLQIAVRPLAMQDNPQLMVKRHNRQSAKNQIWSHLPRNQVGFVHFFKLNLVVATCLSIIDKEAYKVFKNQVKTEYDLVIL